MLGRLSATGEVPSTRELQDLYRESRIPKISAWRLTRLEAAAAQVALVIAQTASRARDSGTRRPAPGVRTAHPHVHDRSHRGRCRAEEAAAAVAAPPPLVHFPGNASPPGTRVPYHLGILGTAVGARGARDPLEHGHFLGVRAPNQLPDATAATGEGTETGGCVAEADGARTSGEPATTETSAPKLNPAWWSATSAP